jgi:hypothetical protein
MSSFAVTSNCFIPLNIYSLNNRKNISTEIEKENKVVYRGRRCRLKNDDDERLVDEL